MKKDIFAKAVRLADKSKVRPEKIVVAAPRQIAKKPAPEYMSERLYLRVTPTQYKQVLAHVPK